jgi:hypothetical protein
VIVELVGILFTGVLGVHRLEGLAAKLMDTNLQNVIKRVNRLASIIIIMSR